MGCGNWDAKDWKRYSSSRISGRNASQIYTANKIDSKYDPKNVTVRESRDSSDHGESTPIIIGLDVTGSMNDILETMAKELGRLVGETLDRKPVSDPQIMFSAIGDAMCDRAPLQVTQFESDIRIASQLTELWFERGGGGNGFESYPLLWYFAANHVSTDAWEKRQKKGFIFTMGDDCYPDKLTREEIKRVFGDEVREDISVEALYAQICRRYEVFHLELSERRRYVENYKIDKWKHLMGERLISVTDCTCIPQIIVSLMEAIAGRDKEEIISSWDGSTQVAVRNAVSGVVPAKTDDKNGGFLRGLMRF